MLSSDCSSPRLEAARFDRHASLFAVFRRIDDNSRRTHSCYLFRRPPQKHKPKRTRTATDQVDAEFMQCSVGRTLDKQGPTSIETLPDIQTMTLPYVLSYVGRTHTIVRLQTRIRRKDGTENLGGFVFVLDSHNGILCCGFLCARLISLCLFYGYHAEGYHARTDTFKLTGYHVCRVTTPELPRTT